MGQRPGQGRGGRRGNEGLTQGLGPRLGFRGLAEIFPGFQPFPVQRAFPRLGAQRVQGGAGSQGKPGGAALAHAPLLHQLREEPPNVRKPGEGPQRAALLRGLGAGEVKILLRRAQRLPDIQPGQAILALVGKGEIGAQARLGPLLLLGG